MGTQIKINDWLTTFLPALSAWMFSFRHKHDAGTTEHCQQQMQIRQQIEKHARAAKTHTHTRAAFDLCFCWQESVAKPYFILFILESFSPETKAWFNFILFYIKKILALLSSHSHSITFHIPTFFYWHSGINYCVPNADFTFYLQLFDIKVSY